MKSLYRAWDIETQTMASVYLIDYEEQQVGLYFGSYDKDKTVLRHFDEVVLMQKLGNEDINNNPIYEYDILRMVERYQGLQFTSLRRATVNTHKIYFESVEVMGNEFENPELVEELKMGSRGIW